MNDADQLAGRDPAERARNVDRHRRSGQVSLSWGAATDNVGVVRYNVHRSTTAGFTPTPANRVAQPTGHELHRHAGSPPGTYYYKVTAEDAAGNVGPAGNEASAAATADTTPPTAPSTLSATASSWAGRADLDGRNRRGRSRPLQRPPRDDRRLHAVDGEPDRAADRHQLHRPGSPAGTYYYRVTAEDNAGNVGPASNEANATVPTGPPPGLVARLWLRRRHRHDSRRPVRQRQQRHALERDLVDDRQVRQRALLQRHQRVCHHPRLELARPDDRDDDRGLGQPCRAAAASAPLIVKERPGDLVYGLYSNSDTNRPQSQVTDRSYGATRLTAPPPSRPASGRTSPPPSTAPPSGCTPTEPRSPSSRSPARS